jgi:hypothetical protein
MRQNPLAVVPVAAAALATLLSPSTYSWLNEGSVANYAVTPEGWRSFVKGVTGVAAGDRPGPDWRR